MNIVNVAKDFSRYPAGRNLRDGPFNGELFRKKFLEQPLLSGQIVEVHLDGTRGYGSSFLEEAFGGLVRLGIAADRVLSLIHFVSAKPSLIQEIREYIERAPSGETD